MAADLETRFWAKVDRRGPDECWPWRAGIFKATGYGQFYLDGHRVTAHRVALLISGVVVPPKHDACHRCDNRICCNPKHLFSGTRKENMQDAARKGRMYRGGADHPAVGEQHGLSKLTEVEVRNIWRLRARGQSHRKIAAQFGVSHRTVGNILSRKRWAHMEVCHRDQG